MGLWAARGFACGFPATCFNVGASDLALVDSTPILLGVLAAWASWPESGLEFFSNVADFVDGDGSDATPGALRESDFPFPTPEGSTVGTGALAVDVPVVSLAG